MCLSVCLPTWENYQANFYCSSYELLGLVVYLVYLGDALHDLVLSAQLKKREKHPQRGVLVT